MGTHAWLWLHDFPPLPAPLEEGICELGAFLYLLELLHAPSESCLIAEPAQLREGLRRIEANVRPPYGSGFRSAAASLEGRGLHDLLCHVREHGSLPPPLRSSKPSSMSKE